jgi:hypothetical protein
VLASPDRVLQSLLERFTLMTAQVLVNGQQEMPSDLGRAIHGNLFSPG